jgi:predicted Fe-S protein YdhL (DUF1289 family)
MRRKNKIKPKLLTPCIRVCVIENGACTGCKRTTEEISEWFWLTDTQKTEIMHQLKTRH